MWRVTETRRERDEGGGGRKRGERKQRDGG